jgi:hypothetical protein
MVPPRLVPSLSGHYCWIIEGVGEGAGQQAGLWCWRISGGRNRLRY